MVFAYDRDRVLADKVYPFGRVIWRPTLPARVISGHGSVARITCLIDSGAAECLFPLRTARLLGLDQDAMVTGMTSGVGGAVSRTYYENMLIDLGHGLRFRTLAGFTAGLDSSPYALLGQQGFFENIDVEFRLKDRLFAVEPVKHDSPE